MAASSRLFFSCNRQLSRSLIREPVDFQSLRHRLRHARSACRFSSSASFVSHSHSSPNFLNFPYFNSLPLFGPAKFHIPTDNFNRVFFGPDERSFQWNFASGITLNDRGNEIFPGDAGPEIAVLMLGWLGGKTKHLRRYVELYNAEGIHAITFVASVTDVLSFDLGKKLEKRIQKLAEEIATWLSNENARERFIIFHTFSNTGWLAYGYILDFMKDKQRVLNKIKGCVVDSGGDRNIDPKVWAAGFTAALLKKNSFAACPTTEAGVGDSFITRLKSQDLDRSMMESLMFTAFEKLFTYLLNIPNINQRLSKIISALSDHQPQCPQLYLYSTADKVIPFAAVESFMDDQRARGKHVWSFNFGSSPHVDHYRSFPDVYALRVHIFLKELAVIG